MEREGNLDVLPMFKEAVSVVLEVRKSWNCATFVCESVGRTGCPMTDGSCSWARHGSSPIDV